MSDKLSKEELLKLVEKLSEVAERQKGTHIPLSIFSAPLSPAEAVVTYLKEHKNHKLASIARLLNRDSRGIWSTYQRAKKKKAYLVTTSEHHIPASIFQNRELSILEHVVTHMRSKKIGNKQIAQLINKSPSTIAAVSHRARRKMG